MTAVTKKVWMELSYTPKADTCAKFQLSRLIFIFISCQQLLTAFDNWWQLSQKILNGIFIYSLKLILVANFSSPGCFGTQLESVTYIRTDRQTDRCTHRRQVKIVPTPALLGWCQGLNWAKYIFYLNKNGYTSKLKKSWFYFFKN